jgi:enoyl-CoA hydratase/carnithine racemase
VASEASDILVAIEDGGLAVVTLNRPTKRNACSLAMWRDLGRIFLELRDKAEVRAVILAGAGGNFCAGADISEFAQLRSDVESGRIYEDATKAATVAIRDFPRPTIAAVSGFGVGGGCGLALTCDFRVGDRTTRMGIPAARLGVIYSSIDCDLLFRQVGLSAAKRILYSGRYFDVEGCARMRLVDEVAADALAGARSLAAEFLGNAPLSIEGSKVVLEALAAGAAEARADAIVALIDRALESSDYREGGRAFLEKRNPVFVGR